MRLPHSSASSPQTRFPPARLVMRTLHLEGLVKSTSSQKVIGPSCGEAPPADCESREMVVQLSSSPTVKGPSNPCRIMFITSQETPTRLKFIYGFLELLLTRRLVLGCEPLLCCPPMAEFLGLALEGGIQEIWLRWQSQYQGVVFFVHEDGLGFWD